ncbi:Hypothetical protein PP7435_CHR1-0438 [Komagataella phaffii CBS 7435]|uniref:Uncharacterized protein n=2 Tax=Komagataella phaffii TaxID=460519 RepID=C4QW70_KOMPG|nr:uncharacterized protein PAS_chr1-1_0478 [Komagataella phaffii GS115]AOA61422.1 GQ67_02706T0 [Komagataella phaffii]CAH2446160.1 Hypothetical protein BQ9382_C1-2275 [Komagataella phaffii CBS 7435]AOA65439.1 GQ68_02542T0 [Komagataella phaffii GS115]CAY67493.1 hypothetical protein PAS_chr1-1_0478 [Komagataella phaffii GS115]CCA36591.1 Hypothetical protein PP7435_CHR1-0438 [Komagataella phaffii CBS 7435]
MNEDSTLHFTPPLKPVSRANSMDPIPQPVKVPVEDFFIPPPGLVRRSTSNYKNEMSKAKLRRQGSAGSKEEEKAIFDHMSPQNLKRRCSTELNSALPNMDPSSTTIAERNGVEFTGHTKNNSLLDQVKEKGEHMYNKIHDKWENRFEFGLKSCDESSASVNAPNSDEEEDPLTSRKGSFDFNEYKGVMYKKGK